MCVWAAHCSPTRHEEEVIESSVCLIATKEVAPYSSVYLNATRCEEEVIPESSVCLKVTKEAILESSVYLNATIEVNTDLLGCPEVTTVTGRIFCAPVSSHPSSSLPEYRA